MGAWRLTQPLMLQPPLDGATGPGHSRGPGDMPCGAGQVCGGLAAMGGLGRWWPQASEEGEAKPSDGMQELLDSHG